MFGFIDLFIPINHNVIEQKGKLMLFKIIWT